MKVRPRSKGLSYALLPYWWSYRGVPALFLILSVSLILFSAAKPAAIDDIRAQTMDLFAPILSTISIPLETSANYVRTVTGLAQIQAENERLRQENVKLREWLRTAQLLQTENVKLKSLLNFKTDTAPHFVTARIIADSGNNYARSLLINAGMNDGIQKGFAVMGSDGLIGRIVQSGKKAARILLITDINSRIPVIIEGADQKAVMTGTNENRPVLKYVPKDAKLEQGMAVITSGHGGVFPYGLSVGSLIKAQDGQWAIQMNSDIENMIFVRVLDTQTDPRLKHGPVNENP